MDPTKVVLGMSVRVAARKSDATDGRTVTPSYTGEVGQSMGESLVTKDRKVLVRSRRGVAMVSVDDVEPLA